MALRLSVTPGSPKIGAIAPQKKHHSCSRPWGGGLMRGRGYINGRRGEGGGNVRAGGGVAEKGSQMENTHFGN